jgi:RNA polymerase sigma-70 factor (ECF subfamily)
MPRPFRDRFPEDDPLPEDERSSSPGGEDWDPEEDHLRAVSDGIAVDEEDAEKTQPSEPSGVDKDMATLALDRQLVGGARQEGTRPAFVSDYATLSDADIMLRVGEGDDAGFNYLIEKYRKPIIHFMFRMVRNQAQAEELAQEVFLRVYRSRLTYRADARFTTWLYRIATNLGVNHARDTKYERAAQNVYLDQPDPETGTTPDLADATPLVEQDLLKEERMKAIRQHVLALPERQRAAVLMHKYQGLDYKQIGEVLKLSESATKSLLFRAYQTLRERLKDFV